MLPLVSCVAVAAGAFSATVADVDGAGSPCASVIFTSFRSSFSTAAFSLTASLFAAASGALLDAVIDSCTTSGTVLAIGVPVFNPADSLLSEPSSLGSLGTCPARAAVVVLAPEDCIVEAVNKLAQMTRASNQRDLNIPPAKAEGPSPDFSYDSLSSVSAVVVSLVENSLGSGTLSPGFNEIGLPTPEDAGIGFTENSSASWYGVSGGNAPGASDASASSFDRLVSLGTSPANLAVVLLGVTPDIVAPVA